MLEGLEAMTGQPREPSLPPAVLAVGPARLDVFLAGAEAAAAAHGRRYLRRDGQPKDLVGHPDLADAEVLLMSGSSLCDRELLMAAPRLRAVISPFIGVEGIEAAAASDRGVLVCNTPVPENYEGVAEGTILLILAAMYDLSGKAQLLRDMRPAPVDFDARMLWRKTVGLIGFGKIAQSVARRLSTWDLRLLVHTRSDKPLPDHVERAELDILLRESDVVVLLTSLNAETHHLIDAHKLALLKSDAVIVNTSRGAVADEAALFAFAMANPRARLALDVFETEPLPADSPLRTLPNALLTPHAIAGTREVLTAIRQATAANLTAVLDGAPQNVVNPRALDAWLARTASGLA
jgi:D-3-phosphoglycerate dehydrogenase